MSRIIEWLFGEDEITVARITVLVFAIVVFDLVFCVALWCFMQNSLPMGNGSLPASATKATLGQHILALGLKPNEELVFEVDFETVSGFCVTAYDGKFEQSVGAGPESAIASDASDKAFELAAEALRTVRMSSEAWPGPVPPAGTPESVAMHEALHAAHEAYMRGRK